jgi:hypothetical protein
MLRQDPLEMQEQDFDLVEPLLLNSIEQAEQADEGAAVSQVNNVLHHNVHCFAPSNASLKGHPHCLQVTHLLLSITSGLQRRHSLSGPIY